MSVLTVAAAGLCGLVLAFVALSLVSFLRVRLLVDAIRREVRESCRVRDAAIEALGARLDALATRVEDARVVPHGVANPSQRRGINLSRRSHALRLHRRGEPAGEIAVALGVPVQEVQLLIKVHEIVMSTV